MLLKMDPASLESLLKEGDYNAIFNKLEIEGLDIKTSDPGHIFKLHLTKGKDLEKQTIDDLIELINSTLFKSDPCPAEIIKQNYFTKPNTNNFIIREREITGFAQVLSLEKTNAAYYSIAAISPMVRSMGFYSLSTCLSIIYGLYKEHDYIVGRTMNPIIVEILSKYGFYYPLYEEPNLILKAKDIMNDYMGREVRIDDRLVLDGSEMNTSKYIPDIKRSNDPSINEFMERFISGVDRLVMIKPIEEDQKIILEKLSEIHKRFI